MKTMRRSKPYRSLDPKVASIARLNQSLTRLVREGHYTPLDAIETRGVMQRRFRRKA